MFDQKIFPTFSEEFTIDKNLEESKEEKVIEKPNELSLPIACGELAPSTAVVASTEPWKHEILVFNEEVTGDVLLERTKKWAAEINYTTITLLENYFKVFALPSDCSVIADGASNDKRMMKKEIVIDQIDYPRIILEKVKCSIVYPRESKGKNSNKCKIRIYLNEQVERDLMILKCIQLIELRISQLCFVPAKIATAVKIKSTTGNAYTHMLTFLFPAAVNMTEFLVSKQYAKRAVFTSTLSATLIRCDWISKAVLPRFVLTNAF